MQYGFYQVFCLSERKIASGEAVRRGGEGVHFFSCSIFLYRIIFFQANVLILKKTMEMYECCRKWNLTQVCLDLSPGIVDQVKAIAESQGIASYKSLLNAWIREKVVENRVAPKNPCIYPEPSDNYMILK